MGRPSVRKLDVPRPYVPGKPTTGPSNADLIRRMLENKKQASTLHGVQQDIPSPEIMREMAMGSAEERAMLKQIWDNMSDAQQQTLKKKIIEAMPDARNPRGVDAEGKQVFSSDAQKIMDAVEGKEPTAASVEAIENSQRGTVPVQSNKKGPSQWTEEEGMSGSYVPEPGEKTTSLGRSGALTKEAPDEQPKIPTIGRPKPVKGLDPKAAGLHDPGAGQTDVRDRQNFRVDHRFKQDENGNIVVEVDDHQLPSADRAAWNMGEHYEQAAAKREELFGQLLIAQTGSQQNAIDLMRRFHDGDEDAAEVLRQVRSVVDSSIPQPKKPFPVSPVMADAGESTPLAQFDRLGRDIIEGSVGSNIYTPKRGQGDRAMQAWQLLQTKLGKNALIPNQVFSSPREMAEQYVRNMSPEWFDVTPITPSQRMDATDTIRQFDAKDAQNANIYLDAFNSDLPNRADKEVFRNQAIDTMEKVFADRFGSQWGEGAQTTTPVDPASMSPAPASSEPAVPSGTTMDPSQLPNTGSPNRLGVNEVVAPEPDTTTQWGYDENVEQKPQLKQTFEEMLKKQLDEVAAEEPEKPKGEEPETFKTFGGGQATYKELSGPDQHKAAYRNFKDGKYKPGAGSSFDEWFADFNRRNPILTDEDMATRSRMIDEQSDRLPGLKGAGDLRTSELLKQIDELQGKIDNYSPEIVKLQEELQAEGLTPARAKEIRAQLKPMYEAHESSIAGHQAELERLTGLLTKSQRADKQVGIQSAKKPPLAGKIGGRAGLEGRAKPEVAGDGKTTQQKVLEEAAGDNPANTEQAEAPRDVQVEDDGAAIDPRPDPASTGEAEVAPVDPAAIYAQNDPLKPDYYSDSSIAELIANEEEFSRLSPEHRRAAVAEHQKRLQAEGEYQKNIQQSPSPQADDAIDPMDSASAADMGDNPLDADAGPITGLDEVTEDAAQNVDAAEAPRDVEAERPAVESETIPPGTGSEATPRDQKVATPQKAATWGDRARTVGRYGAGAAVLGGGILGVTSIGNRVNQQNATGQGGFGGGMPGGAGDGTGAGDDFGGFGVPPVGANVPEEDFGYSTDEASRIRAIQKLRAYVPSRTPQTLQNWG